MFLNRILVIFFVLIFLSGCAGTPWVVEKKDQTMPPVSSDKAQIIFLKPSKAYLASIFLPNVYEVADDNFTHLGMIGSTNKIVHNVKPGKTRFFALVGQMGHILDAELQAGKQYYVILRYLHGGGFQLRPVRPANVPKVPDAAEFRDNDPEFDTWVAEARFVEKTPEGNESYTKYYTNEVIKKAYQHALAGWNKKTPAEKSQLTLNKSDNIN